MINEDLIVASSIREDAIRVSVPQTERCHVVELRIKINREEQVFLTQLFATCYHYHVRCTRAANQLLKQFRAGEDYQELLRSDASAQPNPARQASSAQYSELRRKYQLHEEKVFCKQLHTQLQPLFQTEHTPPSHIAQRIEAAVWRAANHKLKQRRGVLRYPSYSEFRVIEGKNNRANITFDPRPEEMKLRVNGRHFQVVPLRNSDFASRQLALSNAFVSGVKGPGQILYCRIIRRLVNHRGQIEWGYWLQLVVNGVPPKRTNTPKETPTDTPTVVGLSQEPRFLAAYREGSCQFITLVPAEQKPYTLAQSKRKDELRTQYAIQTFRAYRKSRYHQIAKQLLSGATTLYATPMLENRVTGLSDVGHRAFWQSLKDEARHTGTRLYIVPVNHEVLNTYIPKPSITNQSETTGQHLGRKRKAKSYPFFTPLKNAFVLTCLRKVIDPKHPYTRYHLLIDEQTATQRLPRFRRAMARTLHGDTVKAYNEVLKTPELQQWTAADKTPEEAVAPSEVASQKDLPIGNPIPPNSSTTLRTPSRRLVETHLLKQGAIRPDLSVAYIQLSSWLLELPVSILLGRYRFTLTTLRFFYLMIALAQKQIFQEKRTHKIGEPYTMEITSHFLSYCKKGNNTNQAILRSIREELMSHADAEITQEPPLLLFKSKRRDSVYFLDSIEEIDTLPDYYLDIRKLYRVTLSGSFMRYLYSKGRISLPLHVLLDCGHPGHARLISYFMCCLRRCKQIPQTIQIPYALFAELMQIDPRMTYLCHRPLLYARYIKPLLSTLEHYFYAGDINFALWCEPLSAKADPKQPIETQLTFTLQLPPVTTLEPAEYDQLLADSTYYRLLLQQLVNELIDQPNNLQTHLKKDRFWEIANNNPRFYKRIWSTVTRMLWFQGSSREKHDEQVSSHHTALSTQLYSEKALLSHYAPNQPKS